LIVRALAGDSTITRFLAILNETCPGGGPSAAAYLGGATGGGQEIALTTSFFSSNRSKGPTATPLLSAISLICQT
jgi:hypothetical protein